jgi:hypothetical protein
MEEAAQAQQTAHPTLHRKFSRHKALFHVPLRAADATRSASNIVLWNWYLPAAFVRTLVRMGWDYTT